MSEEKPLVRPQCGAKTRGGGACPNAPMPNGKCYHHGGASPVGPASPNFKHGRYSKALGGSRVAFERYQQQRDAPNTAALDEEMALLRMRAEELLANLEWRESGELWKAVAEKFNELVSAMNVSHRNSYAAEIHDVNELLRRGAAPKEIWDNELLPTINLIGKLARVELQREFKNAEMMTAAQAAAMMSVIQTNLTSAVNDHCNDKEMARRILGDFATGIRRDLSRIHERNGGN